MEMVWAETYNFVIQGVPYRFWTLIFNQASDKFTLRVTPTKHIENYYVA